MDAPIRYARSGEVNIAYQVTGEGPLDLVVVSGFVSHLDNDWAHPDSAGFFERLGSFSRLIRFDKRGTGLSDRNVGLPDLETRMDDVRAVMDAVGSERAALFGYSEGGPMSILFAATYPERVSALVLFGTYAKRTDPDKDYPWSQTWEERLSYARETERDWAVNADLGRMAPGIEDPSVARWWAARARASASPAAARDLLLMNSHIDVRPVLSSVQAPTLVVHRAGDLDARVAEGRYIAEHIPGARFVELTGNVHIPWYQHEQYLDDVEEFLTGARPVPLEARVLATVLFCDLVGSTERLREMGDAAWASLLKQHDTAIREQIERFHGEEIDKAGDGFFALFDGPARAIRCAVWIRDAVQALGLAIRVGVHTGEVERPRNQAPRGIAVHTGARVCAAAGSGEVLVSATTRDLVVGSGIQFAHHGDIELKGIGKRALFKVTA
jgi:class 3 adenylate cyclase/pimeloyl-ACP methyl ester carboxylesterase